MCYYDAAYSSRQSTIAFLACFAFLFASIDVLLVLFGLEFHEQFVGSVDFGLQVKASLLADIVGFKVSLELLYCS